jgi:hypothetical protein
LLRYLLCRSSQASGMPLSAFSSLPRFRIGGVFILDGDARSANLRCSQCFHEEAFGCFHITPGAQEKFQSLPLRIHGTIEVHPCHFRNTAVFITAPASDVHEYARDRTRPLHLAVSATSRALSRIDPDYGLSACLSFDPGADGQSAAAVWPHAAGPGDGLQPVLQSGSSCKQ